MVFNLSPPTPLRDMIVTVVKAMPLRLFSAKSQGWGVGSVCSEKLSGRRSVEAQSVSQLDTHQLSKRPHSPSTCFKERALAAHNLGCVCQQLISHLSLWQESSSQWRQHSRGHFGNLWELLLGEAVKVTEIIVVQWMGARGGFECSD